MQGRTSKKYGDKASMKSILEHYTLLLNVVKKDKEYYTTCGARICNTTDVPYKKVRRWEEKLAMRV